MSTYTLIKTDSNFILVSDNPIDMRKPLEVNGEEKISWVHPNVPYHIKDDDYPYEILASLNKIEGLPTLTFDEVVAREIGHVDIGAVLYKIYRTSNCLDEVLMTQGIDHDKVYKDTLQLMKLSYAKAIEDNKERLYTEADMQLAIDFGFNQNTKNGWIDLSEQKSFISALHKTQWQVEIEMGEYRLNDDGEPIGFPDMSKPKITNNSIKVTKIK